MGYLEVASERIAALWIAFTATLDLDPPLVAVSRYISANIEPPYLWIYPGAVGFEVISVQSSQRVHSVIARVVLAKTQSGYDGEYEQKLWTVVPDAADYFEARKQLISAAGQGAPPSINPSRTSIESITPFGAFTSSDMIGFEVVHNLYFVRRTPLIGRS